MNSKCKGLNLHGACFNGWLCKNHSYDEIKGIMDYLYQIMNNTNSNDMIIIISTLMYDILNRIYINQDSSLKFLSDYEVILQNIDKYLGELHNMLQNPYYENEQINNINDNILSLNYIKDFINHWKQ